MWYSVSIFMKGSCSKRPKSEILWEESIVLIEANSEGEARKKGENIAKDSEHQYITVEGEMIHWKFSQIERVYEILEDIVESGTEVFSRFLRTSEVESLLIPFDDSKENGNHSRTQR